MHRAYVVGVPGAGKSTLLRHLTADLDRFAATSPIGHVVYARGNEVIGIQLGTDHPMFGGTDRLSMSVQPRAIGFVRDLPPSLIVIAEGDRLANRKFLDAFGGDLVLIDLPPGLAEARRAIRSTTQQNEAWVRGRATKIARLTAARPHITLDGTLPPADLAAAAIEAVPAFAALVGKEPE